MAIVVVIESVKEDKLITTKMEIEESKEILSVVSQLVDWYFIIQMAALRKSTSTAERGAFEERLFRDRIRTSIEPEPVLAP